MNHIRAPSSAPDKEKKFAWLRKLLRKVKTLLSYRIKFVRARDRQRESIENIEELAQRLAAIRNGTEFRWATEHLAELITALEQSPYIDKLPGITAKDFRAFTDLRRALQRARQASAINDRSDYADYIEDLLSDATKRASHVRPVKSRPMFTEIDRKLPQSPRLGVLKRYKKVFIYAALLALVIYIYGILKAL